MDGLEAYVEVERHAGVDGDQSLTPLLRRGGLEVELPHLAGTADDVSHADHERTRHMLSGHDEPS